MTVVTFEDYMPVPRYDGIPWSRAIIEESASGSGPWTLIDTLIFTDVDADPARPKVRSFTTDKATLDSGWYRVTFEDNSLNKALPTAPVRNAPSEILATLDDINANLDGEVVAATWMNTALLQISVARVIRGYLSRIVDRVTMASWITPETTPDIIREIAGKLIAAQLFFDRTSKSTVEIPNEHVSQRLYDSAMALLNGIVNGNIAIDSIDTTPADAMTVDDFWPNDATDRAFTRGKRFYGQNA